MLVFGIDPGTAITGYGLVRLAENGDLSLVDYGAVLTSANQPMSERLLDIHQKLNDIISLHRPDCGAVEKLFFQKNVRTAIAVGQARGVAIVTLAENDIPVSEYTPLEVKQAVAGYGGADKNQVQQMVRVILNMTEIPKPDDAADAIAVAICHINNSRMIDLLGGDSIETDN